MYNKYHILAGHTKVWLTQLELPNVQMRGRNLLNEDFFSPFPLEPEKGCTIENNSKRLVSKEFAKLELGFLQSFVSLGSSDI